MNIENGAGAESSPGRRQDSKLNDEAFSSNSDREISTSSRFDHKAEAARLDRLHELRGDFYCDISDAEDKHYALGMFPYPSGNAHMGHVRVYTLADTVARHSKLQGANVLNPIGWDSFGLPAENAARKNGVDPAEWTKLNIAKMDSEQFTQLGWTFDKSKEINTCDPSYYQHTQRLFLKLFEAGLAYRKESYVNWDPVDKTVLANEQVVDGKSWRSGAPVEKKMMNQWFLKITDYADRLWGDLSKLENWPNSARAVQRNWIGKTQGANIVFKGQSTDVNSSTDIEVYTTRPDTLFGVSAVVLAPEHPVAQKFKDADPSSAIGQYISNSMVRSSVDRLSGDSKSGMRLPIEVVHPITKEPVAVFVADYVLGETGTGAVMCVPAHDQRDYEFAQTHGLPITTVIESTEKTTSKEVGSEAEEAFVDKGILANSGKFSGLTSEQAIAAITQELEAMELGTASTNFALRDWSIGRQRYWGCPIPIVHCDDCGEVPVPEEELPVKLPEISGKDGIVDINSADDWVETPCPCCGKPATRETDTLDTFVCSSWYAFRFVDAENGDAPFASDKANSWFPIDTYVGGLEHAAQHMLYFRFMTKALNDLGMVDFDEPVNTFLANGMVKKDGKKMSKSLGNVVVPTEIVEKYGADALRLYILSDTPSDKDFEWTESGLTAKRQFLEKNYGTIDRFLSKSTEVEPSDSDNVKDEAEGRKFYEAIQHLSDNIKGLSFHNAVANIHSAARALSTILRDAEADKVSAESMADAKRMCKDFLVATSAITPYFSESLLQKHFDSETSVFHEQWPETPESMQAAQQMRDVVIQVNGKKKDILSVPTDLDSDKLEEKALESDTIQDLITSGLSVKKVITVGTGKLVNFVMK